MGKATKIWLVIGALLVVVGLVMFIAVLWGQDFEFSQLGSGKYETNRYEIYKPFDAISIDTDTADITFVLSQDGKFKVECYEEARARHTVSVGKNTLSIQVEDNRAWYDHIGIYVDSPKITVYLPQGAYGQLQVVENTGCVRIPKGLTFANMDIAANTGAVEVSASAESVMKIKTDTGAITVTEATVGDLYLSVSTGRISVEDVVCRGIVELRTSTGKNELTNVTCKKLVSKGDTGDIHLTRVIAEELFSIQRSTGDVRFTDADALSVFVETDTGDVTGSLLSGKYFAVETDTGKVEVPKFTDGGRCQIKTDTGDIKITVTATE